MEVTFFLPKLYKSFLYHVFSILICSQKCSGEVT